MKRKPTRLASSYVACACRDCFEVAIGDAARSDVLCPECEIWGCDSTGSSECNVPEDEE